MAKGSEEEMIDEKFNKGTGRHDKLKITLVKDDQEKVERLDLITEDWKNRGKTRIQEICLDKPEILELKKILEEVEDESD